MGRVRKILGLDMKFLGEVTRVETALSAKTPCLDQSDATAELEGYLRPGFDEFTLAVGDQGARIFGPDGLELE